ncbi:MAG: DUF393 domain-containing protein [Siphonobacter aquaeclarae]|nr:DUF393 domain-containing protein [Siphonobacter aquaeclarae]
MKVLIYDDACPLCTWYSGEFAKRGAVDNRLAFNQLPHRLRKAIDLQRACSEIPLVDTETGHVDYGVAAVLPALGRLFRYGGLFRSAGMLALARPAYALVSYNRRIVIPVAHPGEGFDPAPPFHRGWRLAFLAVLLAVIAGVQYFLSSQTGEPVWILSLGVVALVATGGLYKHPAAWEYAGRAALRYAGWSLLSLPVAFLSGLPALLVWCLFQYGFFVHLFRMRG